MIVYGTKPVHLTTTQLNTITCPNCDTHGSVKMSIYRNHAHVFWIPIFPAGKIGVSECSNCQNVLEHKQMPQTLKNEYDRLKQDAKGPIWQFVGLLLIAGVISWAFYSGKKQDALELTYIDSPQMGDVYEVKLGEENYSTMLVSGVIGDSIYLVENDYGVNLRSGINDIDVPENYTTPAIGVDKSFIKTMHETGEIFGVRR